MHLTRSPISVQSTAAQDAIFASSRPAAASSALLMAARETAGTEEPPAGGREKGGGGCTRTFDFFKFLKIFLSGGG